ncbi:MAG: hypothetical protein H5U08_00670 [Thermogutta sp.]|uniref:hypothetical protein n=1 Tax=Thermogutta sp. TaxID=1962930 RepID=UPI001996E0B2|nr:hypothetical protein [Thermogutta sp.]MBC7350848.1 hypothetical protein [Thermogutta sp.]
MTDDRWAKFEQRLVDIQSGIAEIRTIYDAHSRAIERIERTLYGNGDTGLCTKVSAILWISTGVAGFTILLAAQAIAAWLGG